MSSSKGEVKKGSSVNGSHTKTDKLMLHYIFNKASLTSPWAVTTIKPWIQAAKDPLLVVRIKGMKGFQDPLDFIKKYPQHFHVVPGKEMALTAATLIDSKCPHCGTRASAHSASASTSTSSASTPTSTTNATNSPSSASVSASTSSSATTTTTSTPASHSATASVLASATAFAPTSASACASASNSISSSSSNSNSNSNSNSDSDAPAKSSPSVYATDILMLHYIFNECSHLITPWTAPSIKPWLQLYKDPLLCSRITDMKGAEKPLAFIEKFPDHFHITLGKSPGMTLVQIRESKCLHCGMSTACHTRKPLDNHTPINSTTSLVSLSPNASLAARQVDPTTVRSCGHGDLFRAIYFHFKQSGGSRVAMVDMKREIAQSLLASHQFGPLRQLKGMKLAELRVYLESFDWLSVLALETSTKSWNVELRTPTKPCTCVDDAPPQAAAPSYVCTHDRLFIEVLQELKSAASRINMEGLKDMVTRRLQRLTHTEAQRVENMTLEDWHLYIRLYQPEFNIIKAGKAHMIEVGINTCSVDHGGVSAIQSTLLTPLATPSLTLHAELESEVRQEIESGTSAVLLDTLKARLLERLTRSEKATLHQQVLDMHYIDWKQLVGRASLTAKVPTGKYTVALEPQVVLPTTPSQDTPPKLPSFAKKIRSRNVALVENWDSCQQACAYIRLCEQIGVDCEGVNLSKSGKLCVVQVAALTSSGEQCNFLFDIVKLEKLPHFKEICDGLASFMQDPKILKVMHDGRQDCSALFHQFSISVANIFDTQIAYRTVNELQRGTTAFAGDTKRIGLNPLLQKYGFPPHPLKDEIHAQMDKNGSNFWTVRPLSDALIQYMVYDIDSLLPLMRKLQADLQLWSVKSVNELSYAYSQSYIATANEKTTPTTNCLLEVTFTDNFTVLYREIGLMDCEIDVAGADDFELDEDMISLTSLLPPKIRARAIQTSVELKKDLIEVVMDHERPVSLRFSGVDEVHLKEEANITEAMQCLEQAISALSGSTKQVKFMSDNRLGISKMLHRISALKSRSGETIGLTYRVGRSVEGVSYMIQDIVAKIAGYGGQKPSSVLFLGRPGVGKTTVLREVSRLLASDFKQRVVIVDTSNEIAGDGDTPHPCIGRARRVQVSHRNEQHAILIETVQNHNPQVIVVDEIGTSQEVEAVKTITQRGVAMVGTAHGEDLHTLLKNPTLRGLIGGVQQVILSASEAKMLNKDKSAVYKKSRLERAGAPTFDIVVELRERHKWRIYMQVGAIIDKLLANENPIVETRMSSSDKKKVYTMFSEERTKEDWYDQLKQPAN